MRVQYQHSSDRHFFNFAANRIERSFFSLFFLSGAPWRNTFSWSFHSVLYWRKKENIGREWEKRSDVHIVVQRIVVGAQAARCSFFLSQCTCLHAAISGEKENREWRKEMTLKSVETALRQGRNNKGQWRARQMLRAPSLEKEKRRIKVPCALPRTCKRLGSLFLACRRGVALFLTSLSLPIVAYLAGLGANKREDKLKQ